jgi:hypothetical protein
MGQQYGAKGLPLTAKVVTTRIAQAPWGGDFQDQF